MKAFVSRQLLWASLVLNAGLSGALIVKAQDRQPMVIDIDVTGARPLADALRIVQERIGVPMNFEEIKHANTGELQKSALPSMTGRLVPRGGHLVTSVTVSSLPSDLQAVEAAQALLAAYASANLPGTYRVIQETERVSIVPSPALSSSGAASPVMDVKVSIPYATKRSVIKTLQLVTEALSSTTGTNVVLLTQPFQEQDTITLGVDGQPAKDVIKQVSNEFGGKIAYHLVYDPHIATYFLNLIPASASVPRTTLTKPPTEGSHSPNNPFFIKTQE